MEWPMPGRQKNGRQTPAPARPPRPLSRPDHDPHLHVRHPKPVTDTTPRNSHTVSQGSLGLHRDTPRRFRPPRSSWGTEVRRGPGRVAEGRGGRGRTGEGRGGPGTLRRPPLPHTTPGAGRRPDKPTQRASRPFGIGPQLAPRRRRGAVAKHSPSKSRRTGAQSRNRGAAQRPPSGCVPPRSARRRMASSRRPAPLPTLILPSPIRRLPSA